MHALRTLDFITSPTLFEHKFMMTNYPYCCYLFSAADKKILQTFTLIYAICIGVCWLINPPCQGWLYMDNGRISPFYASLAFYVWGTLWLTGKIFRNKISQTKALSLTAIILLAIVYYAGLLASPLDERIKIAFTACR